MIKLSYANNGKVIRGRNASESYSVGYSTLNYTTGSLSSPTPTTILDMNAMQVSGAMYLVSDAIINVTALPIHTDSYTLTNLTPSIATLTDNKLVAAIGSGTASILLKETYAKKIINVPVSKVSTSGGYTTKTEYSSGTLASALTTSIDTLLSSKNPSTTSMNITSANDWQTVMIRNNNLWATGVDMTAFCISTGTFEQASTEGGQKSATVISPRHVVSANHHKPARGYWLASDGNIIYREILTWTQIGVSDIAIGYVNEDFPSTIKCIKILPANWKQYLPSVETTMPDGINGIPVAYLDSGSQKADPLVSYTRRLAIALWYGDQQLFVQGSQSIDKFQVNRPVNVKQLSFYKDRVAPNVLYRSGSPAFVILGIEPILIGCWHGAGAEFAIAPMLSDYIVGINSTMATLHGSSQYTIGTVILDGSTAYPLYL